MVAEKLWTPQQVIELLQLDDGCGPELARERLRNRCRAGQFPFIRIGRLIRFREGDIRAVLHRETVGAGAAESTIGV